MKADTVSVSAGGAMRRAIAAMGAFAVVVGTLGLVGWAFDFTLLKSIHPALAPMKANAGACFIFVGIALLLRGLAWPARAAVRATQVCGAVTAVVALLALGEHMFGWEISLGQLLVCEAPGTPHPGVMALPTAIGFVLLGASLLLLDSRRGRGIAQWLGLAAIIVASSGLLALLYGLSWLYVFQGHQPIPVHTSVALAVLGWGIVSACQDRELMRWAKERASSLGFGFGVAVLLLAGGGVCLNTFGLVEAGRWVTHTHEAIEAATRVSSSADDAEGAARGYTLSGREEFLGPYDKALAGTKEALLEFGGLTEDDPGQQRRLAALQSLFGEYVVSMNKGIALRKAGDLQAAADLITAGRGPQLMGRIRKMTDEMVAEERRLLKQRAARAEADTANAIVALSIGAVAGLASLAAVYLGLRKEIAERRQAEQALARAAGYNRRLIEASLDPLVTIGPDGKITDVNASTEAATGLKRQELIGTDFSAYFADPRKAREGYERVFKEGSVRDYPLDLRHKDAGATPVLYNASVYSDEGGKVIGVFAAARDITERKRAEAQVHQVLAELARSNKELEQFAYVASHDLQEPLRMVASYVQLLARRYKGKLDQDADDFIGFAVDGAARMQRLIEDLLTFSRVGTRGKAFAPVDSAVVLKEALANLELVISESHAVVDYDRLPTVSADEVQLMQLFQNLIDNAIKFRGEAPPHLHISAVEEGKEWVFSVRDNGIGIDPRYFDRIFIVFQRLHAGNKYRGTGIGLAVCKKIVERHGGRIWVESKPGQGSAFFFTLPRDREERQWGRLAWGER